ncbi:small basic protein [Tautonia sociabilis]|uniref:Small basic protein n=1 Tax=Tautonia sociabilis TaxID=2080755 RepID=A0A432MNM5_9BACT|nr:small basic protein [Tautonia sociabilis]RUL89012.1 small basic protein [Tautonia sociabilis]
MSMDKSLKKASGLARQRNVQTRAERLLILQDEGRWTPDQPVYGIPKTRYRDLAAGQSGPRRPDSSQD